MTNGNEYDSQTGEITVRPSAPVPSQGERNLIFASPECGEIFGALAEAQGKMANPKKTKSAKVQGTTKTGGSYSYDYKYAPLEEVVDVIRGPMSEAGLVYRQFLAQRGDMWMMRTIIAHRSGQWFGCDYPVFADRAGAQGFASGVTYSRRYGLMLALGLVGEDDDDANVADGNVAKIDGAVRTAQGSPPAATTTTRNRPQAAPARTPGQEKAIARYKELAVVIAGTEDIGELAALDASFDDDLALMAALPDETKALIGQLRERIEGQRQYLLGSTG